MKWLNPENIFHITGHVMTQLATYAVSKSMVEDFNTILLDLFGKEHAITKYVPSIVVFVLVELWYRQYKRKVEKNSSNKEFILSHSQVLSVWRWLIAIILTVIAILGLSILLVT